MIRIVLADDHEVIRASLSRLLDAQPDFAVIGLASDGREALQLARSLTPDVVLMDLHMPVVDGVTAIGGLATSHPEIAVIALSAFQEPTEVTAALAAGARGYLVKDIEPAVLVASVRAAVVGGTPLSPSIATQVIRSTGAAVAATLTSRERQILRLMLEGRTNLEIGAELGISSKTVKAHCSRLFLKIGVSDRNQAAVWAARNLQIDD
jgi:DNA-binding NarL/FixJ family response regulator